jgi:hypothetical protein
MNLSMMIKFVFENLKRFICRWVDNVKAGFTETECGLHRTGGLI